MSNYRTRKSGREEWSGGWSSKLLWTFHVSLLMFMSCFLLNLNYNVYSSSLRQRVQYRLLWLSNHWTDQTDGGRDGVASGVSCFYRGHMCQILLAQHNSPLPRISEG